MIETPVRSSPAMIAALDRRRPAPARQQRRVHVQHLVLGQQRLLDQRPERAHAHGLGRSGGDPFASVLVVDRSGWSELDPELGAASATGGGASRRPRPRGRSGRVTTSAGRCGESASAPQHRGGERRTCRGRPCARGAARAASGRRLRLAQRPHRLLALLAAWCGRGSARRRGGRSRAGSRAPRAPRPRSVIGSPYSSRARTRTCTGRSTSTSTAGRLRQPSSTSPSRAPPLDLGVDERRHGRLLLDAVDEHAVQDADLGGGQPDAERVDHQLAHPRDLGAQRVVEAVHRPRPGASTGSPNLRTWASAALRRAATSGSSSGSSSSSTRSSSRSASSGSASRLSVTSSSTSSV